MKRSEFLKCVSNVYENQTTDYLLALRDALTLMIVRRVNPASSKPFDEYDGYIKYV